MKVKVTKLDQFLDFMLTQGNGDLETSEIREGLKERGFWSEREKSKMLDAQMDSEVVRYLKKMPKHDEQGNVIERVHIVRTAEDGRKQDFHALRLNLTFEDKVLAVQHQLDLGKHHNDEAKRLYQAFLKESTPNECRKLRRQFQGLFDFADDEDADDPERN